MSSSGSEEESASGTESSDSSDNSSSVVEVSPSPGDRGSSSRAGGVTQDSDSSSSFDLGHQSPMRGYQSSPRSSPRLARRRDADTPSSPSSGAAGSTRSGFSSGARANTTPPSATRRSGRDVTPKKHDEAYGYVDVVGGRQLPSGSRAKGGSGGSFTSPLNLASSQESTPSQGGSSGAGVQRSGSAVGGVEASDSAAGSRKKGKGKSKGGVTSSQGMLGRKA